MQQYVFIVGTMLGATEYVADALVEVVKAKGHEAEVILEPELNALSKDAIWVVCSSTHGAGELPDNIQPFAKQLATADLSGVQAYVIGLGDTSYDTYCFGAKTLTTHLEHGGATLLAPPHHIDVLAHPIPEDDAVEWFTQQLGA